MDVPVGEKKETRRRPRPGEGKLLAASLTVVLWMVLVLGGLWFAREYMERTIRDIQETNAIQVQALADRLDSLNQKLLEIEGVLATADDTIARSHTTQEELSRRITDLDRQLAKLEESLKILQEAPHGQD